MKYISKIPKVIIVTLFMGGVAIVMSRMISTLAVAEACNTTCDNPSACYGCRCSYCDEGGGGPGCYLHCCNCGTTSQPPACTPKVPAAPLLIYPPDGSVDLAIPVTLNWSQGGTWGKGCPQSNNKYRVFMRQDTTGSCLGGRYVNVSGFITTTTYKPNNLKPGATYCWYVSKSNGSYSVRSDIWRFSVLGTPQIGKSGFDASTMCGGVRISGRPENPGVNNPVTYTVDVSDPRGIQALRDMYIGVLPSNVQNSAKALNTVIESQLRPYVGFRASNVSIIGSTAFSAVDSVTQPVWSNPSTTGNLPNQAGTATLLDLNNGGSFVTQVNSTTLRIKFKIRFENTYPTAAENVYLMLTSDDGSGGVVSQDGDTLNYVKLDSWATDMQNPSVNLANIQSTGRDTFRIDWLASDVGTGDNGIKSATSSCQSLGADLTLRDDTLARNINLSNIPVDCLVNATNLGTHNYTLPTAVDYDSLVFNLQAQDGACNISSKSSKLDSPIPWLITSHGATSAGGGFTGFKIRSIASLASVLPGLDDDSYLGTYSLIAGNSNVLADRVSKFDFIAKNYQNLTLNSPGITGVNSWYEDLEKTVEDREGIANITNTYLAGSIKATLGTKKNVRRNGDLVVRNGVTCDQDTVIFVTGKLTLRPNVLRTATAGCVFVVKGNVEIERGANQNTSTGAESLVYDQIEVFVISDRTITIDADPQESSPVSKLADPLHVRGGLIGIEGVVFGRNLGLEYNGVQPAEAIEYDPFYAYEFRDLLSVMEFSLRAK